ARDEYYNLEDDAMVKNIFNSGKHKDGVGIKIPIKEHLIAEEIEKLVKRVENVKNVKVNSSTLRQDDTQNILGTRLELRSDKESSKVEITTEPGHFKRYKSFFDELQGRYGYLFEHLKTRFMPRKKFNVLAQHLQDIMENSLPIMVDNRVNKLTKSQVPVYAAHGLIMERQQNQADVAKMISDAIWQERENLRSEIALQINDAISNYIPSQVDSLVKNYMSGHILHVHLLSVFFSKVMVIHYSRALYKLS
nr:hypothetical protein [Tanacetum cinerariifolium]